MRGLSTGPDRASKILILWLQRLLAMLALTALAACAETLDTKVTRFSSALPPPAGQTFVVLPEDPALNGGIEFGQYAHLAADHLTKLGYVEVPGTDRAALVVRLAYGVDKGHQVIRRNWAYDPFWGPWRGYHGWGYGPGYWHRGWGPSGPWGWGWYDPWFDDGFDDYTVYTSEISLKIDDHATGKRLFEGKAQAASTSNRLPWLVPNLIEAMFTKFPGNSGETLRITVAPEKPAKK